MVTVVLCYVVLVYITVHVVKVITSAIGPLSCPCVGMNIMLYSMVYKLWYVNHYWYASHCLLVCDLN